MMKTKRLCQAVYLLFCLIQIALLGAVYILQTLTTKKLVLTIIFDLLEPTGCTTI